MPVGSSFLVLYSAHFSALCESLLSKVPLYKGTAKAVVRWFFVDVEALSEKEVVERASKL